MSSSNPQRKRLPVRPNLENLKKQAKRLARLNPSWQLAEAQHALALDYGCKNWAQLAHVVETMNRGADQLVNVKATLEPLPATIRKDDLAEMTRILATGDFTQHDLDKALAHAVWYQVPGSDGFRKQMAQILLDHGADPDGQYGSDYGPIVFGTGECLNPGGLQFLIDAGADVTFQPVDTKYGRTCPLSSVLGNYARTQNDIKHKMIDLLLQHNAFIPPEVSPPILAIHRGDDAALAKLLDADPSLLTRRFPDMPYGNTLLTGATLLHCAAEFTEIQCLDLLLDRGADINMRANPTDGVGDQTPIFHLINTGWDSSVKTLQHIDQRLGPAIDLFIKASFRRYGELHAPVTPLEFSLESGPKWGKNSDVSKLLHALAAQPLFGAIQAADVPLVRSLLQRPIPVDVPDSKGNSTLWYACAGDGPSDQRIAIASLLLERGAPVRRECQNRATVLHAAASQGSLALVQLLLRHGAKEWQTDKDNKTALDYALAGTAPDKAQIAHLLKRPVINDPHFKSAVEAIHAGDLPALKQLLAAHPNLIHDRAIEPDCYPDDNYFSSPRLLWFVANNPNLIKTMPPNIGPITQTLIAAGASKSDLDHTLGLVMTSGPCRDQDLQIPLMQILLAHGATPGDLLSTLAHRELGPVRFLVSRGIPLTAPIAAALGKNDALPALLVSADSATGQAAFAIAVINQQLESARLCLDADVDVNLFMPVHSHCLPIHFAAENNDVPMLKLLVEHGSKLDVRDKLWNSTPLAWATHGGHAESQAYLRSINAPQ